MDKKLENDIYKNMNYFYRQLNADKNFDLGYRMIRVADRDACIYFLDGFIKDEIMEKLLEFFYSLTPGDLPGESEDLTINQIPYVEVNIVEEKGKIQNAILSGQVCLMIDGYPKAFMIDCRTYPMRNVSEPEKDKTLRGSRDGFVETLVFNTALIRRRIRNRNLIMKLYSVGESSLTDIVVCYMEERADDNLIENLDYRLTHLKVDALPMNQESLAETLFKGKWLNPFPKFKYTERPDAAAASILEGKVVILVDNAPSAMILPATLLDIMEEADDYYFPPVTGTYLRMCRLLIAFLTLFVTPVWLLLIQNPGWIPSALRFIQVKETIYVPIFWQLLFLELAIDGLKLAAINTPDTLSTPLSVIAGIVVGEFAIKSGWFNSETMLYMAFVAIANYTQSNYELGFALKFMRILLLILVAVFQLPGFIAGVILILIIIFTNHTISGTSYLYPIIPFRGKQLRKRVIKEQTKGKIE